MSTAIAWLRTILFRTVFYTLSVPIVLAVPVSALFGQRVVIANAIVWARVHRFLVRWLLGIRLRIEGSVPAGQFLFAAKHQAMFETVDLQLILGAPTVVLKQELMRIPAWGYAARRYGAIVVDREASAKALRKLIADAKAARVGGRSVIVYPEGTRVKPGEQPALRSGFAGLYKALALPVVPIALDTGRLLPKSGAKRSGVVTVRIGAMIPPGLPRAEAETRVHAAINVLDREQAGGVAG